MKSVFQEIFDEIGMREYTLMLINTPGLISKVDRSMINTLTEMICSLQQRTGEKND